MLAEAERLLNVDPDAAIAYIDSTTNMFGASSLNPSSSIRLQLTLQQAYAKKRMMDSVIAIGVRIRSMAAETGDSLSMARSLLPVRGEVSMADQQALEPYLPGAVRIFRKEGLKYEEAVIEGLTGAVGIRKGDFAGSMTHLYHARDILENLDSTRSLYSVYMNIGNGRSAMKDQRGAIEFFDQATRVARKINDSVRLASALMNEGIAYSYLRVFDASRLLLNEALAVVPSKGGELAKLQILFNVATLSERQGILSAAEADYRRVLEDARAMGDPVAIGMANSGLAGVLGVTGRVGQAIGMMEGTVRQLDSIGLGHYAIEHTDRLVSLYKEAGRYADALAASERLKKLSDSLLSIEKQTVVRELEAKYQNARKEAENSSLRQEVRVRSIFAIGLLVAVTILFVLIVVMRQRNRYHRALNKTYERLLADYRRQRDEDQVQMVPHGLEKSKDDRPSSDEPVGEGEGAPLDASETLTSEEDMAIFDQVMEILKTRQPHLGPSFKSEDIANQMGITPRKLSQVIKLATGHSFTQFINRLRIDEATRLMERPHAGPLKIDAIAGMCGFSNRQHFRRVFEQVTGVTPGYFRKSVEDPASE